MQEEMTKIRETRLSERPEGSELDSEEEEEIYSQVLSSKRYEKYGFKRGVGPVPKQPLDGRKSRGLACESLRNEVQENQRRMSDMEALMKQQQELIQKLLQQVNAPSEHPGPNNPRVEDPPPPPPSALVC